MSDAPRPHTSRAGLIVTLVAVFGSAVSVMIWHLVSNRSAGLDTTGFDMSTEPERRQAARPAAYAEPAPSEPTSLGMVKSDERLRTSMGPAATAPGATPGAPDKPATPADPKAAAVMSFKEAAAKHEKVVDAYVRRMQAKYPSIGQYGKDWVKHPDLVKLRDEYWKNKDPLAFAYGLAKSDGFGQLVKKYATDPGIRAVLMGGIKEAPPALMGSMAGLVTNDKVAKDLLNTVMKATGLPPSLVPFLDGSDTKAPDANAVLGDIMKSGDVQKAMQNQASPVPIDQQTIDKAKEQAPNGFTPLGGR